MASEAVSGVHPSLLVIFDDEDASPAPARPIAPPPQRHKLDNRVQPAAMTNKRPAAAAAATTSPTKRAKLPSASAAAKPSSKPSSSAITKPQYRSLAASSSSSVAPPGADVPLQPGQVERVVRALYAANVLPTAGARSRASAALAALTTSPLPPLPPPLPAPAPAPARAIKSSKTAAAALPAPEADVDISTPPPASAPEPSRAQQAREALARTLARLEGRAARPLAFELQQILFDCSEAERFSAWAAPLPPPFRPPSANSAASAAAAPAKPKPTPPRQPKKAPRRKDEWWAAALESDASSDAGDGDGNDDDDDESQGEEDAATVGVVATIDEGAVLSLIADPSPRCYESPLLALRSYRLSEGYLDGATGRRLTDAHARARLHPTLPLCRFELHGECRAEDCTGQHRRDYLAPSREMRHELLCYSADGPPVGDSNLDGVADDEEAARSAAKASAGTFTSASLVRVAAQHAVIERNRESNGGEGSSRSKNERSISTDASILLIGVDGGGAKTPGRPRAGAAAAQLQLLHAALRVNPQPSLLAGDLGKQLVPMLSKYKSADAAALEAAALDGAAPAIEHRGPVQALPPTVAFEPLTANETARLAAAAAIDADRAGDGKGTADRYWRGDGEHEASVDDSALATQLTELGESACWRRVLTLRLGGDALSAGASGRRSAMRVLSRCLEQRTDSTALWAAHLSLYGLGASAAELREQLNAAVRQAPCALLLWNKLASLQTSASVRVATRVRALHTLCNEVSRKRCSEAALLPAALSLLRELAASRMLELAERVADVLLAADAEAGAERQSLAQEASRANNLGLLPPIPRVTTLLPPAALAALWLARVELLVTSSVSAATAASDEQLRAVGSVGSGPGCMLPWSAWTDLDRSNNEARRKLDEALSAVGERFDALALTRQNSLGSASGDAGGATPRVAAEERAAALWLLRLNRVGMELALGDPAAADAACKAFMKEDFRTARARCDKTWRLWARVPRKQPGGDAAGSSGGGDGENAEAKANEELIWQARLSEQPANAALAAAEEGGPLAAEASRFELWHALLLSSARSKEQAIRLVACAASERQPPECGTDHMSVWSACKPTPRQLPSADASSAGAASAAGSSSSEAAPPPALSRQMIDTASTLLRAWLVDSRKWRASRARECAYLHLIAALWMQLTATAVHVQSIFEAGLSALSPHGGACVGGCRAMLWLRYLSWGLQTSSGLTEQSILTLLRRFIERRDEPKPASERPQPPLPPVTPRASHLAAASHAAAAASGVANAGDDSSPPVVRTMSSGGGGVAPTTYDERDDTHMLAVLATEPARSFFHGCAFGGDSNSRGIGGGGARGGMWAWEAEAHALAVHMALRRVSTPRRWELGSAKAPAGALLHIAARAARAGAMKQARTALAAVLKLAPSSEDAWTLAIWIEASEGQWEAAATLAHIAVANQYGSAELWSQWLELEDMRGNVETLLRLRALASAAGVRSSIFTTETVITLDIGGSPVQAIGPTPEQIAQEKRERKERQKAERPERPEKFRGAYARAPLRSECPPWKPALPEKTADAADSFDHTYRTRWDRAESVMFALNRDMTHIAKQDAFGLAHMELTMSRFKQPDALEGVQKYEQKKRKAKPKRPWSLPISIWAPRVKWADSRDFWDTDDVERKMFETDWERCLSCGIGRFIYRMDDGDGDGDEDDEVDEVVEVLWEFHDLINAIFDYYAAMGASDDITHMQMNSFSLFVNDCGFPDKDSQFCKTTHFDQLFIAVDSSGAGGKTDERFNRKKALNRQEFIQALVKIACMRYVQPGEIPDVSEAVHRMFSVNIEPQLDPNIFIEGNVFRNKYTYFEEADAVLRRHEASLRLIFERACKMHGQSSAAGIRNKCVSFAVWKDFCKLFELVDLDLTERDMTLAFVWSRMRVIDEQSENGRIRLTYLAFEDWLEALCRVSVCKAWPTREEIEAAEAGCAGTYLFNKKRDDPEGYAELLSSRNITWGKEPTQHISHCIDHLCSYLIVMCQQNKGDGKAVVTKEVNAFIKVQSAE